MNIAATIKRLRREQDMTQEVMAEYLGLSPQAISRWETGQAMPDISLLPALANLFGVTTDELLGMNDLRQEQHLSEVFGTAQKLRDSGKYDEAAELLRGELALFPRNWGLMSELAITLTFGDPVVPQALSEAISLCERVLAGSSSEKLRATTRSLLALLYQQSGQHAKALSLVKTFPHIWESREMILAAVGDEEALRQAVLAALALAVRKTQRRDISAEKELIGQGLYPITQSPQQLLDCLKQ